MKKVRQIHSLTDIVAGYRAVLKAIDAVLSQSHKKQYNISSIHYAIMAEVFNHFTGTSELYEKYIIGSDAHGAHADALIEVRFFTDNPSAEAPDSRARLFNAKTIIKEELLRSKQLLLEAVKSL